MWIFCFYSYFILCLCGCFAIFNIMILQAMSKFFLERVHRSSSSTVSSITIASDAQLSLLRSCCDLVGEVDDIEGISEMVLNAANNFVKPVQVKKLSVGDFVVIVNEVFQGDFNVFSLVNNPFWLFSVTSCKKCPDKKLELVLKIREFVGDSVNLKSFHVGTSIQFNISSSDKILRVSRDHVLLEKYAAVDDNEPRLTHNVRSDDHVVRRVVADVGDNEDYNEGNNDVSIANMQKGFSFTDLDGVQYICKQRANVANASQYTGLLRMMNADRKNEFLSDFTVSLSYIKNILSSAQFVYNNVNRDRLCFHLLHLINNLPVFSSDKLFLSFLKGNFDPLNWNNLSLFHFLPDNFGSNFCIDDCSRMGRDALVNALDGLENMMVIFFDECFKNVFMSLKSFFGSGDVRVIGSHNLYMRVHLEVMISSCFRDLFHKTSSNRFPLTDLSSSEGRMELIESYIKDFINGVDNWAPLPHYPFYQCVGHADRITVDYKTFTNLIDDSPFKKNFYRSSQGGNNGFQNNYVNQNNFKKRNRTDYEGDDNNVTNTASSLNVSSDGIQAKNKYNICGWFIAEQLNVQLTDGKVVKCRRKNCSKQQHKIVNEITVGDAYRIFNKMNMSDEIRNAIKSAISKQSFKFAK